MRVRVYKAPNILEEEVRQALYLRALQPAMGSPVAHAKMKGVRRIYLARVHYHLYYRLQGNEIQVVAFWHSSRGGEPPV